MSGKSHRDNPPAGTPAPAVPSLPVSTRRVGNIFTLAFCAWLLAIPAGVGLLNFGFAQPGGQEVTQDRIRFLVVNALTLTGFDTRIDAASLPPFCALTLAGLTLLGSFFVLALGGLAAVRLLGLPYSDGRVLALAGTLTLVVPIFAALPLFAAAGGVVPAWVLASSAIGNSGLRLGPMPPMSHPASQFLLLPLAVLGGLGVHVIDDIVSALRRRRPLTTHSRTLLLATAVAYLLGTAALLALGLAGSTGRDTFLAELARASSQSLNCRGAGFNWEYMQPLARPVQWCMLLLMLLGAGSGAATGGVGLTTLVLAFRGLRRGLTGNAPGRPAALGLLWMLGYLGLAASLFLAMLLANPSIPADRLAFETVSALTNVGLSFDRIVLVTPALDVLLTAMLLGRLAPLAFLWWLAERGEPMDLLAG